VNRLPQALKEARSLKNPQSRISKVCYPKREMALQEPWSIAQSDELYRVQRWGQPYFRIGQEGHLHVQPDPTNEVTVDLKELAKGLTERGISLPVLVRFPDILEDRIRSLNEAFRAACAECDYQGGYRGVYPIKVNQQRHLVDEIVERGRPWSFGLEVGSRPELLIALAVLSDDDGFIICNGYKDVAYLETALLGQQLKNRVLIVLERTDELALVLEASERLGLRPTLGIRAKLSSKGVGRWASSSGDRAKFGLTAAEILSVVSTLREREMLDCLELLHFHIGSQVSSITPFKNAIREASHLYTELVSLGAKMGYLDVGGGLAVDYDGSRSDFRGSRNYDLQSYASDIVSGVHEACDRASVAEPVLVSESGRAISAHHSVLLFEAIGQDQVRLGEPEPPKEDEHRLVRELFELWEKVRPKNIQESWHDILQARDEARSLFKFGFLPLPALGRVERLFWHVAERIHENMARVERVPDELNTLHEMLGAIYYCNFSLFQSAPDIWAIDQLFPLMPIHRLQEEPGVKARIADLTCDSDGMIEGFIDAEDVARVLDVHEMRDDEPYILGMFLVGAYQEILGDLHNLFGDTNAVHISVQEDRYEIDHVIRGDRVDEVFHYVQYDPEEMQERVRRRAEKALSGGAMSVAQMRRFLEHYETSLRGYTYLKGRS